MTVLLRMNNGGGHSPTSLMHCLSGSHFISSGDTECVNLRRLGLGRGPTSCLLLPPLLSHFKRRQDVANMHRTSFTNVRLHKLTQTTHSFTPSSSCRARRHWASIPVSRVFQSSSRPGLPAWPAVRVAWACTRDLWHAGGTCYRLSEHLVPETIVPETVALQEHHACLCLELGFFLFGAAKFGVFFFLAIEQLQFLCTMSSTDTNRPEEKQEKQSKAPRKEALFASPAFRTSGC